MSEDPKFDLWAARLVTIGGLLFAVAFLLPFVIAAWKWVLS
jgi:hypothetical protein